MESDQQLHQSPRDLHFPKHVLSTGGEWILS
jgi:hypothetical protein